MAAMLLVDDHAMFREGLLLTIAQSSPELDIQAVSTGQEALAVLDARDDIALVVMDYYLADMPGSMLIRQLRQLRHGIHVLVVSASEDPADVHRAIAAGAGGFVHKTANSRTLLDALAQVAAGRKCVPSTYSAAVADAAPVDEVDLLQRLTPRQTEVLLLVSEGLRNGDIAERLGMTEKTVKAHMSAILAALNVPNRTQAGLIARRGGLLGKPN